MAKQASSEMRTLDPVLTTLARGYSNKNYVAEHLFPMVEVASAKGRIPLFGKSAFLKRKVERAAGSSSNRIPLTEFELLDYQCLEKDIEMAIDYLEEENANNFYKFEQRTVRELCDILELGREIEAAEYATNISNYPADLCLELDEASAFSGFGSEPEKTIKAAIEALRLSIGVNPNTMVIDKKTFHAIMKHQDFTELIKYSGEKTITTSILGEVFGLDKVIVASSVYSENGVDFKDIWGNNVIIAYVDPSEKSRRSELNPSFGYTLRKKGMPEVDSYFETGGKVKVIRNTDNYCIKATSPDAAFLITNTFLETIEEGE